MRNHDELTSRIIAAAIQVHRALGPGFLEAIYEEALSLQLARDGIPFARQVVVPVLYLGTAVGEHRLDMLVGHSVVVELKASKGLDPIHFATVRSYMRACGADRGLLLNFASMPLTIRRVGCDKDGAQDLDSERDS